MNNMYTLSKRMFKIRTELGFKTQDELGAALGLGKGTVSRWENGTVKEIPQKHMIKLEKEFGINSRYIQGLSENMFNVERPLLLEEDVEKYGVDEQALVTERFMKQARMFAQKNDLHSNRDLSKYLGCISEDLLSKISNGTRSASLDVIKKCGTKMKIDFNYTMYGIGSLFYKPTIEYEEELVRLKRVIDALVDNQSQSKLA